MQDQEHIAHAVRCAAVDHKGNSLKGISIKVLYLSAIAAAIYLCLRPTPDTGVMRLIATCQKASKKNLRVKLMASERPEITLSKLESIVFIDTRSA